MQSLTQQKNFWSQMAIRISMLAAMSCLCGAAARAQGTLTWDWSYNDDDVSGISGSGTLTTETNTTSSGGKTGYLVTDITGTWNPGILRGSAGAITGLLGVGTVNSLNGGINDNLLLETMSQLDDGGVAFATASGQYSMSFQSLYNAYLASDNRGSIGSVSASFSAVLTSPVPEPSTNALLLTAASGLIFLGRPKLRPA